VTGENDGIKAPRRNMMPPRSHPPPMGDTADRDDKVRESKPYEGAVRPCRCRRRTSAAASWRQDSRTSLDLRAASPLLARSPQRGERCSLWSVLRAADFDPSVV
jgi:hypothetical protein